MVPQRFLNEIKAKDERTKSEYKTKNGRTMSEEWTQGRCRQEADR
jgi:hypothetical protein